MNNEAWIKCFGGADAFCRHVKSPIKLDNAKTVWKMS